MSDPHVNWPQPNLQRLRDACVGGGPSAMVGVMVLDLRHALERIDALEPKQPELALHLCPDCDGTLPAHKPGCWRLKKFRPIQSGRWRW